MGDDNLKKIDGVLWQIKTVRVGSMDAICPMCKLRMWPYPEGFNIYSTVDLKCEDCQKLYRLPRTIADEHQYIIDKLDSKRFKQMKVLNLDDEAIPIAEDKPVSDGSKYFVKAILTNSKIGQRLVVYVGEKGRKEKTQIFVEPEIKRLSFDQNNLHPYDIFLKLEATFEDGSEIIMKKNK
jgi:hypothetical protein